jgi:murein DD-endopeptidase MepM/ murein hydrolase activator NlpD
MRGNFFRPLTLEALEDRRVLANLAITSAFIADGNLNAISQSVVGERIMVRVNYTTNMLAANASYRIGYTVDGVTIGYTGLTTGAGLTSGSFDWSRSGWYAESPGTHNASVFLDADNTVAETNEADNTASFSFNVVTATPPVKFTWPQAEVPFKDQFLFHYLDLDPTSGTRDWAGGLSTYDGHQGIDTYSTNNAKMDIGIPILAAAPGTVIAVEDGNYDRNRGTIGNVTPGGRSNYVIIDHGSGWRTQYHHLRRDSVQVQVGDVVNRGDRIGLEGSSGDSTDSHLHLDVNHNLLSVETFLDPSVYWQNPPPYVGSARYLVDSGVTNYNLLSPVDHFGERASDVEVFSQEPGQTAYVWGAYSGLRANDTLQTIFKRPNGTTFATNTLTIPQDYSGSTWFAIRPLPTTPDAGTWTVELRVNSVLLGTESFVVTAAGAPEVRLDESNGQIVLDGRFTPYDLGTVSSGAAKPTQTFTVVNHGTASLTLGTITLPMGFDLVEGLPSSLAPGTSDTFTIGLNTSTAGYFAGQVRIPTNDASEFEYNFSVEGTVTSAAGTLTLGISERHVRERGRIVANVRRSGSTASALTVNLVSGDTTEVTVPTSVVIPAGKSSTIFFLDAVYDGITDATQIVTLTASASGFADAKNTLDVENLPAGFSVTQTGGTTAVSETGTIDTLDIVLSTAPLSNVVVSVTSGDTTEAIVGPTTLTFTPQNWNVPKTVTVTGVDDPTVDGSQISNVTIAVVDASSEDNFDSLANQTVSVTTTDNDVAGFSVSQTGGTTSVSETGANDTFDVVLTTQPLTDVVFTIASNDTTEATISPAMLTFTSANWNVARSVMVTGVNDPTVDGSQTSNITIAVDDPNSDNSFDSLANQTVSVTTSDDDVAGFSINQTGDKTSVNESGTTDTFDLVLTAQPLTNVVFTITSGDTTEATVSPATIIFTMANWNIARTVTVTGVNDSTVDGSQNSTVTVAVDDGNSDDSFDPLANQTVSATTVDNDVAGFSVTQTGGNTTVNETGTTDTFDVVLTAQPLTNVVLTIVSADTTEATAGPATITFTPADWNVARTAAVIGVNDQTVDGNQNSIVTIAIDSANSDNVFDLVATQAISVTTVDDDVAGFTVGQSGGTTSVNETGTSDTLAVVLTAQPLTDVELTFVSGNTAEVTVSPDTLTFTTANWNVAQTVTVTGVNDQVVDGNQSTTVTISIDDANSDDAFDTVTNQAVTVTTVDDEAADFSISQSGGNTSVSESGTTDTFGVVLSAQPLTNVVLSIAGGDTTEAIVSPPSVTFTPANWNTARTVTVTGVNDNLIDGNQSTTLTVSVSAAASDDHFDSVTNQSVSVSTTDDDVAGFLLSKVTANVSEPATTDTFNIVLTAQPGSNVVFNLDSSDPREVAVSPTTFTFTAANWNSARNVIVTAVDDPTADGSQSSTVTIAIDDASSDNHFAAVANQRVSVTTADDDVAGFSLSQTEGTTSVSEAGTSDTFDVVLTAQPLTNVVVQILNSGSSEATVDPPTLTFTPVNWNAPRTVTVAGVDDPIVDGDQVTPMTVSVDDANSDSAFNGLADQEVVVTTIDDDLALDFGDAPSAAQSGFAQGYPTRLIDDGARHASGPLAFGTSKDLQADGLPSAGANGDDTDSEDDEDGVLLVASIVTFSQATTSSYRVIASQAGRLDGWVDFNRDGDWIDGGEQIYASVTLAAGENVLSFAVPAASVPGNTYARFRLSLTGGLAPTGLAEDGEVEDYAVTVLDGAMAALARVDLPFPDATVQLVGNDLVVQNGAVVLFRAAVSAVPGLRLFGGDQDNHLNVANLPSTFTGPITIDLGMGMDWLILTGNSQALDMTKSQSTVLRGVELVDIRGSGDNTLTVNQQAILDLSDQSDSLSVMANMGDAVNLGSGWVLTGSQVDGGQFFRILRNGSAQLLLGGPANHQNPVNRHDTNADHAVVPVDALVVINELNLHAVSNSNGSVIDPALLSNFGNSYRDVNGDGFITPIDALVIINFLNALATAEGEGGTIDATLVGVFSNCRSTVGTIGGQDNVSAESSRMDSPTATNMFDKAVGRRSITFLVDDSPTNHRHCSRTTDEELAAAVDEIFANSDTVLNPHQLHDAALSRWHFVRHLRV